MIKTIKSIKLIFDRIINLLAIFIMSILVIDVVWQVIARYVLKNPGAWTEELSGFLLIWAGLLGTCISHREKAHLGIDYLVEKFQPQNRDLIRILISLLTTVFAISVLVCGGCQLVKATFITNQYSPALGIQMGYVYLILPISGILIIIYSLQQLRGYYIDMKKREA
ncbi:MAG: hypothetical protein A2Y10_10285 [Planctomycetes bacterium GWF2_41_51]|nr:MAG: hypothetical protein A2Y10_10285 [Planctomycetes bacterium GWF2_41_51]HBG27671.1 TRAP transporter small permease [Phycisphaerales bacterium]